MITIMNIITKDSDHNNNHYESNDDVDNDDDANKL